VLGSALAPRRLHDHAERRLLLGGGLGLVVLGLLGLLWPWALAWPLAAFSLWLGSVLLLRGARERRRPASAPRETAASPDRRRDVA
jgi:cardiolipin synthase